MFNDCPSVTSPSALNGLFNATRRMAAPSPKGILLLPGSPPNEEPADYSA